MNIKPCQTIHKLTSLIGFAIGACNATATGRRSSLIERLRSILEFMGIIGATKITINKKKCKLIITWF